MQELALIPVRPEHQRESETKNLNAVQQSRHLLALAREEALDMGRRAKQVIAEEKEKARARGYQDGYESVVASVLDAAGLRKEALEEAKKNVFEVTFLLVEEVLGEALKIQPESIRGRITRALKKLEKDSEATLFLHPEDFETIRKMPPACSDKTLLSLKVSSNVVPGNVKLVAGSVVLETSLQAHLCSMKSYLSKKFGVEDV